MIQATKNRLRLLFALGIVGANLIMMALIFFYLHESILSGLKADVAEHAHEEFKGLYLEHSMSEILEVDEDEVFQIYNRQGDLIGFTQNSANFKLSLDLLLLQDAFKGKESFQMIEIDGLVHLVYYFPLSEIHVGRLVESIPQLEQFESNMAKVVGFSLPGVLLLSVILARWLVNLAMTPITLAYRYQDSFSSNLTHELHSPLTSLKGNLEVALRKERSNEEYQDVLQLSLGEVGRIISLLNDLHLLASSSFSPLSLEKTPLDLKATLQGIIEAYEPVMEERGIRLQVSGLTGLQGRFDAGLIQRAFANLIANAVKYTLPGGEIAITALQEPKQCRITLANDSAPLSKEELKRILEPFYRAQNAQAGTTGKGLGLNIANYIFHSHGGSLEADYRQGKFILTVLLPL